MRRLTRLVVPPGAGARLDAFLSAAAGLSRRAGRERLASGAVRVNGRRARKGDRVGPGDVIELDPAPERRLARQGDLPIRVLFEDDDVVVVDKPSGVASVAINAASRGTVANFLAGRYGSTGDLDGGLVQRLDNETSGVLLAARTEEARRELRRQLRARLVTKLYLAVVHGDCPAPGAIEEPIGAVPRRPRRVAVRSALPRSGRSAAREAVTFYRPLRRYGTATLLEVTIPTGVRHQIRVHLASIGHPVLGDRLYARNVEPTLSVPRLLLHAREIRVRHPSHARVLRVRAPLPSDWKEALRRLAHQPDARRTGR